VDDHAAVRGAIRNFFETRTSYLCDEASDGLSGIRAAEEKHCELVVLDLNMPNLNGVETAAILREKLPRVKIVGFSSYLLDADFRDALLATNNFDAVLAKSASLSRLAEVVKSLIPEPADS
jgi:DNA-binding NarL/FixJ family response regulator